MPSVTPESLSMIDCQERWDDEDDKYPILRPSGCQTPGPMDRASRINFINGGVPRVSLSTGRSTRPPSGLAEALMMDQSGESALEDIESVESFMGFGRGKPWSQAHREMIIKVGRGRGSAQAKTQD